jgi:hypothetical protein
VFQSGPCRDVISKGKGQLLCSSVCEVCKGRNGAREAEETPLLETVASEWLVKTQQIEKP